jgi:hypothetical protein
MTWLETPTTMIVIRDYNAEAPSQEVQYISTSENSAIRKVGRARGKRIHRTCITWVQHGTPSAHPITRRPIAYAAFADLETPLRHRGMLEDHPGKLIIWYSRTLPALKPAATSPPTQPLAINSLTASGSDRITVPLLGVALLSALATF